MLAIHVLQGHQLFLLSDNAVKVIDDQADFLPPLDHLDKFAPDQGGFDIPAFHDKGDELTLLQGIDRQGTVLVSGLYAGGVKQGAVAGIPGIRMDAVRGGGDPDLCGLLAEQSIDEGAFSMAVHTVHHDCRFMRATGFLFP